MLNFNTAPYFDDFAVDGSDKFYRILFRPGFAVQARELTQLQTILQNQIKSNGDHIFQQGAMVLPGQTSVDTNVGYVKLQAVNNGQVVETYVSQFLGQAIVGTSGITAQVVHIEHATSTDPTVLYVKYTQSGTDGTTKVFADSEIITISNPANPLQVQAISSASTGAGSISSIARGIYYVNGFFVVVDDQTIILDKYDAMPSYRIGLSIVEKLITPEDMGYTNLLDNAQGSYNFAAPGAHRYFIDLIYTTLPLGSTADDNFIELVQVQNGNILQHVVETNYSAIESTLAKRTFDEAGNYTVSPFQIDVREHRSNSRGQWAAGVAYLLGDVVTNAGNTYVAANSATSVSIAPTQTTGSAYDGAGATGVNWAFNAAPYYNRGINLPENGGDETKLAIGMEPGTAYVQGYAISKIATEYIPVSKARATSFVNNAIVPATVGSYVLVKSLSGLPPVDSFGVVNLYASLGATGTIVGTARVRFIEWHDGVIGTATARYKLSLFAVTLTGNNAFNTNVKSFGSTGFHADIDPVLTAISGSITLTASSTACAGVGTSFQTQLHAGDYIQTLTDAGAIVLYQINSITSQNALVLTAAATAATTAAQVFQVSTIVLEQQRASLLFPFPYSTIETARGLDGTNETTYAVYQKFSGTSSSASGGNCTLTVSTSSGTFASAAQLDNYIVSAASDGSIVSPTNIVVSSSSVTFTLPASYASSSFSVIGAVNKSGVTLTEKTKTLVTATATFSTQAAATAKVLQLGAADGFKIVSIMMGNGTWGAPGTYNIDVSDRYTFDNGQRATHYDVATLARIASFSAPTAPIQVQWEYFTHSTGDYFTVNSYPASVAYGDIPLYQNIQLRDTIDFRPRISDDGASFTGSGSTNALVPKRGVDVQTDFSYYLGRKTKIALDFSGNFFLIDGVSSLNPGAPQNPSMGMVLCTLSLAPYTFDTSASNVNVAKVDNKRYTMRDIGALESRIGNLEYYTALSLLEQETSSMNVVDSLGDARFKNGFIVDSFTGQGVGDTTNPDYLCAVDMTNKQLRPFFSMQNVPLIEQASNDSQRAASDYKLYGSVITLPVLQDLPLITQSYASRLENINPFAVFTFLGDVNLTPASDDWFEVNQLPDIIVNIDGQFNAVKNTLESEGVLGTVWGSWQTQWTGTQVSDTTTELIHGSFTRLVASWFGIQTDQTTETTTTTTGQARNGINTSIIANVNNTVVSDVVVSTAVIPYIRSRNILVQATGLKPSTAFHPFFDSTDVSSYCKAATQVAYTPVTGRFDYKSNAGGNSTQTARQIAGDAQVCLVNGDIVTGGTSHATGVVVGEIYAPISNQYVLYIVNIIGTFTSGETITGSLSGATGTVGAIAAPSTLTTDTAGSLVFLFDIPDTTAVRFRTGSRMLTLVDSTTFTGAYTSRGMAPYFAQGVIDNMQRTVNSVKTATVVQEQLNQTQTIVQTSQRVVAPTPPTPWYDPLAQSFLINQKGGAFLTKVDVFFGSKDAALPITLEIRNIESGVPGQLVLPYSKVTLTPDQVKLSTNMVLLDGMMMPDYMQPTTFTFPSPVYVQDAQSYALVLSSDSNNYQAWVSRVGDVIPGSSRTISEQPYLGSLFKSQNVSTWTADQTEDLKFTIYRAQFDVNAVANVAFTNGLVPSQVLGFDPIEVRAGNTTLRVYQSNHGLPNGSKVTLSSVLPSDYLGVAQAGTISTTSGNPAVTGSGTTFTNLSVGSELYDLNGAYVGVVSNITSNTALTLAANAPNTLTSSIWAATMPIAGIPASQLYATFTVGNVEADWYSIVVGTAPTLTGYAGGGNIKATHNIQFDALQPTMTMQTFPETITSYGLKGISGKSPDSSGESAYLIDSAYAPILVNDTNIFNSPKMIASAQNETQFIGGAKSAILSVSMKTTNDSVSPVLDTQRMSLIAISNKINNPSEATVNIAGLDDQPLIGSTISGSGYNAIAFSGSTITSANAGAMAIMSQFTIGKYLTIVGSSGAGNNGTFLITEVAVDGSVVTLNATFTTVSAGDSLTISERLMFTDEITPAGSSTISKYVTKQINLTAGQYPSTYLRVLFSASIPSQAGVRVMYRVRPIGSQVVLSTLPYTEILPDSPLVYTQPQSNAFTDVSFSTPELAAFDAVQVKLVMNSTSTSSVPLISDLRVLACA